MLIQATGQQIMIRADNQDYDFVKTQLENDYEFHDLDLSAFIPPGTKAVFICGVMKGNVADSELTMAKAGYTGSRIKSTFYQSVANQAIGFNTIVPVSNDLKIKYKISYVTWEYLAFSIIAWWI